MLVKAVFLRDRNLSLLGEGVNPLELWKTSEIRIRRRQIASVFYCKRSEMCVSNQVGHGLPISEHQLKYGPMFLGRANDPCTRLVQPALDTGESLFEGERMFEDPRIGPYPNECRQDRPA